MNNNPKHFLGLGLDVYLLRVWCPSRILSDPAALEDLQRHAGMFDIVGKRVAARCAYYPKFFQGIPELLTLNYRIAVKNAELQVTSSSRVHKRLQKIAQKIDSRIVTNTLINLSTVFT